MNGEVAFLDGDDAGDAVWGESMERRVDDGGTPRFGGHLHRRGDEISVIEQGVVTLVQVYEDVFSEADRCQVLLALGLRCVATHATSVAVRSVIWVISEEALRRTGGPQ